jgi:transposase
VIDLSAIPEEFRAPFQVMQQENLRLVQIIKLKDEQIRLLNLQKWGPKAEKLSDGQLALLPGELLVMAQEIEQEANQPEEARKLPRAKKPRGPHPGRESLPEHLERRETIIPCAPQDCACTKCGQPRPIIGYDEREELGCEPAKFFVQVIKREKRGSHCHEEQGVAVAAAPGQIVPKGKLSNDFIIEALAAKFQQHTPIYRQCAVLAEEQGIFLSRQTVNEAILAAGQLLIPVVQAQARELLKNDYIQADETTVPCQTEEKKGKNHRAYIWEFSQPGGLVVFDFQMGRSRRGPAEFLKSFKGKVQCDGYSAYAKLGPDIKYVACMAHIRREFMNASKVTPKDPLPVEVLFQIGLLYEIERQARSEQLSAEARLGLRHQKSQPILRALHQRIMAIRQAINPGGTLAKACNYALGQWSRMEEYLKDGQIEIDNNWCEGAMRPIALGRKNWLHVGSQEAGPKLAAIMSIVETCRRLDIQLRLYLRSVLPKLGAWPINRVGELTPANWKAAQKY